VKAIKDVAFQALLVQLVEFHQKLPSSVFNQRKDRRIW
jgi:hypothetical protein